MTSIDIHIVNKFDSQFGHHYDVQIYIWKGWDIVRYRCFKTRNPDAWAMVGHRLMQLQWTGER